VHGAANVSVPGTGALLRRRDHGRSTALVYALQPDFGTLSFTINSSHFFYGDFINSLITFVSVAAAVFFFVIKPVNYLQSHRVEEDSDTKECPECTSAIPVKARRCPLCTAQIASAEVG
jgi:large conductance mechanosensitive channel